MNVYQNPISFTGKINTDDTTLLLPQGDYFLSEYFRVTGGVQGETGQGQSVTGNLLIPNEDLPEGENKVIGTTPYTEQNSLIYFVHNSEGNHSIYMVNNATNVVTRIARSSVFNFQLNFPIIHAFVLDKKLYWTDGYFGSYLNNDWNGPRRLDIDWALGGGVITREAIAWDIYQPWRPPTTFYETNTSNVPTNYLIGKLFQFRYQWVYRTGEESVFSPISKCNLPSGYFVEGVNSTSQIIDNIINVVIQTGSENVRFLRVAYRQGNSVEFSVFSELDKDLLGIPDNSPYVTQFTRDQFIYSLPLALANNERFPRIANCVELLPTNEAAFANFYEGYDRETPLLDVRPFINEKTIFNGLISYAQGVNRQFNSDPNSRFAEIVFNANLYVKGGRYYFNGGDELVFQLYNASDSDNPTEVVRYIVPNQAIEATNLERWNFLLDDLQDFLLALGYTADIVIDGFEYKIQIGEYYFREAIFVAGTDAFSPPAFLTVVHPVEVVKTFKTGALHQFALQYYDTAQKDGTVWRSEISRIEVPSVAEISPTLSSPSVPFYVSMQTTIGGINGTYRPPIWATHYQVMYKPPKIEWQQRVIKSVQFLANGRVRINLEDKYEQSYRGANISMQIQAGDIVRFIRRANNARLEFEYLGQYCDEAAEVFVYEYGASTDSAGEYITIDNIGLDHILNPLVGAQPTPSGSYTTCSGSIIEIYRVSESLETDPWFEIGECYPVVLAHTPNRVHQGQNFGVSGQLINIVGGNAFFRKRPQGGYNETAFDFQMAYIEDPDFSDYFPSRVYDYGRIGIEDVNAKERRLFAAVGHTSQYLDNTRINRLNQVDFQNVKYLREEHGPISRIVVNGYTLSVLQHRKNTSIYIQRTMAVNGSGASNLILTDRTFSDPRPLEQDWGAVHGGGVIVAYGNLYYYDFLNGIFVVSTGGGQLNLSLESKYMKGTAAFSEFTDVDTQNVFSCVNTDLNEIRWTFTSGAGVAFCPNVGFTFNTNHVEDCIGSIGNNMYGFKDGNVYRENKGVELNFYGEQKNCKVGWVFNVGATTAKMFLNLWLQSNKRWDVEEIKIKDNLNYTTMESFLPASFFNAQEGALVAPYMRDITDPSFTDMGRAFVDGRALRGFAISHIMSYSGDEKVLLFNAAVRFAVSNPVNS
jgi:hypothetical protein